MRALIYLICMFMTAVGVPYAWADIYTWMDEDGVRHISNLNPPAHAEVLIRMEERSLDEAVVQAQQEAEEQQTQLRKREAQLSRQKAELERRLEEAEQRAQETLEEAEEHLAAVEARYSRWLESRPYATPASTVTFRPYGFWHHRHRHPPTTPRHKPRSPIFVMHPFHLGAIRLPLGGIPYSYRRHIPPSGRKH